MPNKSKAQKDWKESPSGKHGDQNKNQDKDSGNKGDNWQQGSKGASHNANDNWQQNTRDVAGKKSENWQQFQKEESRNANDNWQQAQQDSSRNANDNWQQDQQESSRNMNDQWQVPAPNIDLGDQAKAGCLRHCGHASRMPSSAAQAVDACCNFPSSSCLCWLSVLSCLSPYKTTDNPWQIKY